MPNSQDIRYSILTKWYKQLENSVSDNVHGTSPPSVFVGSYGYPDVSVGPMVPPTHGDTSIFDLPEKWTGKTLDEIIHFRLNLVRGITKIPATQTQGRYIENLQEFAMSAKPADSELSFEKPATPNISLDDHSAPFGPIGKIKSAKFFSNSPVKQIEKVFYDKDLKAKDAMVQLYNSKVEISKIQKCFSIGMLGQKRRLVPTKWSITATDDAISRYLQDIILENPLIDSCRLFYYTHLGNHFSVILFPHRWAYELVEAWYSDGILGFGSDSEDARGIDHSPITAGAYYAAKLGILEYLKSHNIQAGALVLREIRPEYAIPVGVWQVREGVRQAMRCKPIYTTNLESALNLACKNHNIDKNDWLLHSNISNMQKQKTLTDYVKNENKFLDLESEYNKKYV